MKKILLLTTIFLVAAFSYNEFFGIKNLDKKSCIEAGYKYKVSKELYNWQNS